VERKEKKEKNNNNKNNNNNKKWSKNHKSPKQSLGDLMTHACNLSFSKSKRVDSEDMKAALLNHLYLRVYTILV
jgi:hypothetical protein